MRESWAGQAVGTEREVAAVWAERLAKIWLVGAASELTWPWLRLRVGSG